MTRHMVKTAFSNSSSTTYDGERPLYYTSLTRPTSFLSFFITSDIIGFVFPLIFYLLILH